MKKNIFIFDENKCVGCHACVVACINENDFQAPEQWRYVHKSQEIHFPELPLFYLSLACNHCDEAPCLKNCPALAYSRDEKTGAVIHHPEKCIGCKYCTWACPYDAPKFNPNTGIIEKCTFCNHRIEENLKPACANLCPVGALDFSNNEFSDEESRESSPVDVKVGSKIKINKLRTKEPPEIDHIIFSDQPNKISKQKKHPKISALDEWPLVIFTLLTSILVGTYSAGITESFSLTYQLVFLAVGAIAAILSMFHLGKKIRVWRSVLNPINSWLSKEIIFFALFMAAVFCEFFFMNLPNFIVIVLGIAMLLSIDMLYVLAQWRWPLKIHSAQTIFIGITVYSLLADAIILLVFMITFRLTLYLYKTIYYKKPNWFIPALRVILPVIAMSMFYNQAWLIATALIGVADLIGRIQFYNELKVPDPGEEMSL